MSSLPVGSGSGILQGHQQSSTTYAEQQSSFQAQKEAFLESKEATILDKERGHVAIGAHKGSIVELLPFSGRAHPRRGAFNEYSPVP